MKMKTFYLLLGLPILGGLTFDVAGCRPESSESKESDAVAEQQDHYQKAQPIPRLDYSLERDIVIQLYKARNERVATHAVWRGDTSVIEGDCPSIGYPVPFDTSLTNPLQLQWRRFGSLDNHIDGVVEQPEPNGVFASKNSIATWVRCVVDGQEVPVYVEGKVTAYPFPVTVDYETNRVVPAKDAKPSVVIKPKDEPKGQ